jgi:adenine-specific DNA-methyltransferase
MEKLSKQEGSSLDVVNENLEALKDIFPEAFTENGVDFEVLRQLLGDAVDEGEEKYGLNWHGKKKARQIALMPSLGTLRPCPEESVDWDTTQNLFIEGDNLEVLKLLQKSYANKVKMIYIDPPYNTGKEFIYPDKFQDNLDTYLRYTGQKDDEGFKISSNTENSGRYHTNWLNMMYPRLKLARNLLKDDGVIFISIDDHEVASLRKICDEIFGEENFVANVIWQRAFSPKNDAKYLSDNHDHLIIYGKNLETFVAGRLERTAKQDDRYKNPDSDPRGVWVSGDLTVKTYLEKYDYPITTPNGRIVNPSHGSCWRVSKERFEELKKDNRIWFGVDGNNVPRLKRFLSEVQTGMVPTTLWLHKEVGHNQEGRQEVKELFDGKGYFDGPKPIRYLKRILQVANLNDADIVLDFFAGSATTAHAVLDNNKENNGNRKYIMVQLPEPCDEKSEAFKAGYKNIAEIGKERVRRAAAKIKEENLENEGDLGFKVFKLGSSNIRAWNPDRNDLEQTLIDHMEHLIEGRSEEDVLYELLLKRGVELTVPIEEKTITGKTVYSIGYGVLFACLDTAISREEVEDLAMGIIDWHKELEPASDTQVVFRDSAFANDIAKTNMTAILEQHGIAHVRSL